MNAVKHALRSWLCEHREWRRHRVKSIAGANEKQDLEQCIWAPHKDQLADVKALLSIAHVHDGHDNSSHFIAAAGKRPVSPPSHTAAACGRALSFNRRVPTVLVSACLLGRNVAYHGRGGGGGGGTRKKSSELETDFTFLVRTLVSPSIGVLSIVPLCPEVDVMGLPVPRPPIRLMLPQKDTVGDKASRSDVDIDASSRIASAKETTLIARAMLQDPVSGPRDVTDQLLLREGATWLPPSCSSLRDCIDGAILKSRSPTCGVGDARYYYAGSAPPPPPQRHHPGMMMLTTPVTNEYVEDDGLFVKRYLRGGGGDGDFSCVDPTTSNNRCVPMITERRLRPTALHEANRQHYNSSSHDGITNASVVDCTTAEQFLDHLLESFYALPTPSK